MTFLFISDLHLHKTRPETSLLFLKFLETEALKAKALYILGDFFEVWIGDDNLDPHDNTIIQALAQFSKTGIPLFFMHGNRDFLIGKAFTEKAHCTLLSDPHLIEIYDKRVLLMHGDSLCTQDKKYQLFRKLVRSSLIKRLFLSLPLFIRQKIAKTLRTLSESGKKLSHYSNQSYDVAKEAVLSELRIHQADYLIHGHTHVPGIHEFELDNIPRKRIVLGEWGKMGSILTLDEQELTLEIYESNFT